MGFISPTIAAIAAAVTIPAWYVLPQAQTQTDGDPIDAALATRGAGLQVNAPFQKIKNHCCFGFSSCCCCCCFCDGPADAERLCPPGERVVIVIDHSASMNTKDADGESRLEAAKERALDVVDNLDAGGVTKRAGDGDRLCTPHGGVAGLHNGSRTGP